MSRGFPTVPLKEVLYLFNDQVSIDSISSYSIAGVYSFGRGLFARQSLTGSETTYKFFHHLHNNDFVLSQLKGWEGALARVSKTFEGWFLSPQFQTFRAIPEKMDISYFEWYCKQSRIWEELKNKSRGMGARRDTVSPNQFLSLEIPLPPLEEQRRIVARIEELSAKIEEARGLRKNQQQETEFLLESILKYTCTNQMQGLTCKKKLGDITTITSGGTPSRTMASYWDGDIPWIKTGELLDGDIYQSEECLSKEGLENSSAKLFPPGTILIALYGQGQTRGRTGRLMVEASTNQACCAILPNPSLLNERFTQYWLRGLYTHMRETAHGGAQPNWNSQTIKNIVIALPSLTEQESTISYFDSIQKQINLLKHKQAEASAELDALLPSILDKAFKGEL